MSARTAKLAVASAEAQGRGLIEQGLPEANIREELHDARAQTSIVQREQLYVAASNAVLPLTPAAPTADFVLLPGWDVDCKTIQLRLTGMSATGGTNTRFANGIWSAVESIELQVQGQRVVFWPSFNLRTMLLFKSDVEDNIVGQELYGVGTQAQRIADAATARTYFLPLSHLFSSLEYFFRDTLMSSQDVRLRVNFAAANVCLEDTGGTSTYTIVTPELVYDGIKFDGAARSFIFAQAADGYRFHTMAWADVRDTAPLAATSKDMRLDTKKSSVGVVWAIFRPTANIYTTTVLNRLEDWRLDANLATYQIEVDGKLYPPRAVNCGALQIQEAYMRFLQASHGGHSTMPPMWVSDITFQDFAGLSPSGVHKFVPVFDFRKDENPAIVSGLPTALASTQIVVKFTSPLGLAVAYTIDLLVDYDQVLTVFADGTVHLQE